MSLKEKLKKHQYNEIWQQYCGFLDLSMEGYMKIQRRLMEEQIQLWSNCGLGQSILKGKHPKNLEEFRKMVPLTEYEDYADILLTKQPDMLPGNPVIWIQTTWEGGKHPIKVAPYTRSMLDTYRNNVMACLILSTSREKGSFDVASTDKFLYALAPLPYATGLFPLALGEEIDIEFLPAIKDAVNMSFSERNKLGFKMAMQKDLGFFFGLGSVAYAVSLSLSSLTSSGGGIKLSSLLKCKPQMIIRLLKAKYRCKKEQRQLLPKDLFHLKGFMVAGTDNLCYKDDLEELWGIRPMELFAGTEPSMMGTETWTRKGMYFFPDNAFYEFITEEDMLKNHADPSYIPPTYLMDEVRPGELAEEINKVRDGVEKAVDNQMKSERLKTDLITNVSHDIKTPLTSIINYVDILKRENIQDERIAGYIEILNRKALRLKQLTEDLVEASKISSGNITLTMQEINLKQLIKQTNGEFEEKFAAKNLNLICDLPEEQMLIRADGRRMFRVIENLYNNAAKYAMPGTRVYVTGSVEGDTVVFYMKNVSESPLNFKADELLERFVRGDVSRSTEGSGLGLEIARNLTVMQDGTFDLYLDGDLFKVTITFKKISKAEPGPKNKQTEA